MKKILALAVGLLMLGCLDGCENKTGLAFYGTYRFDKVSYLSPLSSATIDYDNERMAGTRYIIKAKLFRIESADGEVQLELESPEYRKEDIIDDKSPLVDIHTMIGEDVHYQYTIYGKSGSTSHYRLYESPGGLRIASYVDNTANGSEIIMRMIRLGR